MLAMTKSRAGKMSDVMQGPEIPNRHGHDFKAGFRTSEGYAVCCLCGTAGNSDAAAMLCQSKRLAAAEAEVERFKNEHGDACKLVAQLLATANARIEELEKRQRSRRDVLIEWT